LIARLKPAVEHAVLLLVSAAGLDRKAREDSRYHDKRGVEQSDCDRADEECKRMETVQPIRGGDGGD